jgi:DNA-binding beta-propeller fold protein YncE
MYPGAVGECVIVPDAGAPCDDGSFCTLDDTCDAMGECIGGPPNDCGMTASECNEIACDEDADSCGEVPSAPGSPCQDPNDLCIKGSTCNNGLCTGGMPDDCFFSPVPDDCHVAVCNPMNGMCEPVVGNEGGPCTDTTDLCTVAKTCAAGQCTGGTPKDCSHLSVGCNTGYCDTTSGSCMQLPLMNGDPCNDFNNCTTGDQCQNGACVPQGTITSCTNGDMCCPQGCDTSNDDDCSMCDWNPTLFPITYGGSSSVGDMTFDASCNLYLGDGNDVIRRINHNTSTSTQIASFTNYTRGITFNPNNGLIYVAVHSDVYSMTTSGTNVTLVATVGGILNGMTIAPPGWGSHGGHLILSRNTGQVHVLDPGNPVPAVLGTTTGALSDVEFDTQNGVLYVAAYDQNKVLVLSPTGAFTTFSNTPCSPDGLAVESGQRVFITCGSTDQLQALAIPGGAATFISASTLNGGWAPAGAIWDGQDNLIVMEDGGLLKVYSP